MSERLKRVLCVLMTLAVVFSFSACRHSPVLEQTIYSQDAEVDPENQQTDNDIEHTEENTTLPPRTQQQTASRQSEQTKVSAKPKPTTNNNQNTSSKTGSQTPKTTGAKPSSTDNTNKAQGDTPGITENGNSPNKAVDRKAVKAEDIPENVATVAATGQAALFVEMLGGSNRLKAADANLVSLVRNGFGANVFSDAGSIQGLWEHDGESEMSDAQFQQLLTLDPEAVFYIADANYGTVRSFSGEQLTILNQRGIYTIPLAMFNTTNNIKNNVRMMGKVLGKRSDISGAKDANDMAKKYCDYLDDVAKGFGNTFSGPGKWNLDQDGFFGDNAEVVNSYADSGQYTILIDGWDDSASTRREAGVAYARTGYSKRNSPASFFLSLGGAANTAVLVTDTGGNIPYFPIVPTYMDLAGINVRGHYMKAAEAQTKSNNVTGYAGNFIGRGSLNKIIVDSANTYNAIMASLNGGNAWAPTEYVVDSEGTGGYGYINASGNLVASNIHGNEFEIVINPYGIGSWTEGSPEAPLEALWANQLFNNGLSADDAFNAIASEIQYFYSTFYGYSLSGGDLEYIKAGGP